MLTTEQLKQVVVTWYLEVIQVPGRAWEERSMHYRRDRKRITDMGVGGARQEKVDKEKNGSWKAS